MSGIVHLISSGNPSRASEAFAHSKALSLLDTSSNISINLKHNDDDIAINIRGGEAFVRVSGGGVFGWTFILLPDPSSVENFWSNKKIQGIHTGKKTKLPAGALQSRGFESVPGNGQFLTLQLDHPNEIGYPTNQSVSYVVGASAKEVFSISLSGDFTTAPMNASFYKQPLAVSPDPTLKIHTLYNQGPHIYRSTSIPATGSAGQTIEELLNHSAFLDIDYTNCYFYGTGAKTPYFGTTRPYTYISSCSTGTTILHTGGYDQTAPYSKTYHEPVSGGAIRVGHEYPGVPTPIIISENPMGGWTATDLGGVLDYAGSRSTEFFGRMYYWGNGVYLVMANMFPLGVSRSDLWSCIYDEKHNSVSLPSLVDIGTRISENAANFAYDPVIICGAGVAVYSQDPTKLYITFDYGVSWRYIDNTGLDYSSYASTTKMAVLTYASPSAATPSFTMAIISKNPIASNSWVVNQSNTITATSTAITWTAIETLSSVYYATEFAYTGASTDQDISKMLDAYGVQNGV